MTTVVVNSQIGKIQSLKLSSIKTGLSAPYGAEYY